MTAPLPTGTVTFLLTDVEGSTQLWEQYPEAMQAALAQHDALAAECFARHNGVLIKSRGEGDSLFAVFARASDAIAAACAFQIGLTSGDPPIALPLRVRMAIHAGEACLRDGDYYGPVVNRCARLRNIGHGGQILVSLSAQELAQDTLPPKVRLRDLGLHGLRDLSRPERVFQVIHPDLRADFPPLKSLSALANNLPLQLTSFIGREREIAEIKRLLPTTRLLTITGEGGCGKTRLVLQTVADLLEEYPDGVWQVELAGLAEPAFVPQAVATALGLQEVPGRDLTRTLSEYLQPRQLLLILDNCEHLLPACAQLATTLLRTCPYLRLLATSREALGVPGERSWRVPSMAVPSQKRLPPLSMLAENEVVQLFVERAASVLPTFALTAQNAPVIVHICRRLDGIPLAIELAAARVKVLGIEQIAARLDDCFRLLTGGSPMALPRHQTLRATIDWSYGLLSTPERALLRRLAVFSGSWSLEAAEAVCVGEDIQAADVLDLLTRLIDKSLAIKEELDGVARYRLLETVRQYGQEQMDEVGERSKIERQHREFFRDLALRVNPFLYGAEQADWLKFLDQEYDNLRAALLHYRTDPDAAEEGLRLANALYAFWDIRGYFTEGREQLESALEHALPLGDTEERAKGLAGAGALAWRQGDYKAARRLFEEGLAIRQELGDQQGVADMLNNLGNVAWDQGDYPTARSLFEQSLEIMQANQDQEGIATTLSNLALLCCEEGQYDTARALFEQSLAIDRQRNNPLGVAFSLDGQAEVAFRQQDYALARTLREDSLKMRRELGDRQGVAECLEGLAAIGAAQGRFPFAACLLGAAESLREALLTPLPPRLRGAYERLMAALQTAISEEAFNAAWTQGRALTWEQAATYALDTSIEAVVRVSRQPTAKRVP